MWNAALPDEHLRDAIRQFAKDTPVSFVQLMRFLPQLRGTEDLAINTGFILWRGVSDAGVRALRTLHGEGAIFFWLCSPSVYTRTGDAPFLHVVSRKQRLGESVWLPTLIFGRPPTTAESRSAVKEYVAEITSKENAAL
jgi:hypothetical protein